MYSIVRIAQLHPLGLIRNRVNRVVRCFRIDHLAATPLSFRFRYLVDRDGRRSTAAQEKIPRAQYSRQYVEKTALTELVETHLQEPTFGFLQCQCQRSPVRRTRFGDLS